ncbi:hypothetical protein [Streptomyces marincola]|uniref:hypothetical protein n=1 Tax=Streptomyces marincola TaxID=2878388 RepID=UPI001CF26776|nr:hypothetical protein [Streptomyces marincola]UCM89820.1 hypothetical protein LC193_18720 [Streptomyces marincola]
MRDGISSLSRIPLDPDVPAEARAMAEEVGRAHAERESAEFGARQVKARDLVSGIQERVRGLFGAEEYVRFRHFLWREGLRVRDLMLPPRGLTSDYGELHRERRERADVFLRGQGVAPEELARILREQHEGLADIFRSPPIGSADAAYPADGGEPGGDAAEPRAFATGPPFSGFQRGFHFANLSGSGFRGDQFVTLVPSSGIVGHQVRLTNDDASDFDFAEAVADAQIAFWFQPGMTGRVSLTVEAQCQLATHSLRTEDEWGWSDSSTNQDNFLMTHVLHPNVPGPSFAGTSHFHWRTDATEEVFRRFVPVGTTVVRRMVGDGVIPAGQFVVVRVGTRTTATSWTNDVVIHSTPDFRWLIRSIAIHMVP